LDSGKGILGVRVQTFCAATAVIFVLGVKSQEQTELESVAAVYPGNIVTYVVEILPIAPGSDHVRRAT
jgi:hypothetical protein